MKQKTKIKGRLRSYLSWPLILSLMLLIMVVHLFIDDRNPGIVAFCYFLAYFIIALIVRFLGQFRLRQSIINFAIDYSDIQRKVLKELTIPFAILTTEGQMLWGNDAFVQIIGNKKAARRNISNVFSEITLDKLPHVIPQGNDNQEQDFVEPITGSDETEVFLHFNGRHYRAILSLVSREQMRDQEEELLPMEMLFEGEDIITIFLDDITRVVEAEQKLQDENLIVGLVYIDNYDEMLAAIEETRQPLMLALIERKINSFMQGLDAVCKKMEKDKFIFVCKQKSLQETMNTRFSILEDIRTTNIGTQQANASISIGVGVGDGTFAERYEFARAAIDLALGRGGDQAVVKYADSEDFFGGKRVQVERNTRVKARVKAHALRELIVNKERVIVMGHTMADTDSFGAAVGIYRIAKTLDRSANIVINQITESVAPIKERFFSTDYDEDMMISGEEAKDLIDEDTLLVIVDVNQADRTECPDLLNMASQVVLIDHHRLAGDAIDQAVLSYVEPYASSASEMVSEICQYINGLKLRSAEAEAMYAGVMIDTNFFSDKCGVRTFEAMAYLRRNGADSVRIRKMFREDLSEYKVKAATVQDTELYLDAFAIAECPGRGIEAPTILGAKIANSLLDISNVKASFVLTKYNGKIYVSARSIDEVNVQLLMERMGGGGHVNMAGCQIQGLDIEAAKQQIRDQIDQMIQEGEI